MPLERTLEPEVMDTVEDAVDYDAMDHSAVNQLFVQDLLQFLSTGMQPTSARELIVDLGTGTIRIPLELLEMDAEFPAIAACDLSFEMLKLGQSHLQQRGRAAAICPVFCDAKRLPFADGQVRGVISNSIIHHIPEPLQVLQETRRVLAPGGYIFFRDLLRPDSAEDVEHLVQMYAGDEIPHAQQLFRESLHAALSITEMTELLRQAGLRNCAVMQTSDRHWTVSGWPD